MKRLTLLTISILLLLAGPGWAANYYVANGGNDASADPTNPATPWQTIVKVNAFAGYNPNDWVYFKRGDSWDGTAITVKISSLNMGAYGTGAPPSIRTTNDYSWFVNGKSNCIVERLRLSGVKTLGASDANIVRNCIIDVGGSTPLIQHIGAGNLAIYNSVIAGSTGTSTPISVNNAGASLTMRNDLVMGNRASTPVLVTAGSKDVDYCCFVGNDIINKDYSTYGAHTVLDVDPKITTWPHGNNPTNICYFIFTQDDQDVTYASEFEAALPTGWHHTFFINQSDAQTGAVHDLDAGEMATLNTLITGGMNLENHSRIHNSYSATYLFRVTSTNTNPTINVDIAGNQIILFCDEVGNRVTQTIGSGETIANLKTSVVGKGWTVTTSTVGAALQEWTPLSYLADSGGAQPVPASPGYSALVDTANPTYRYYTPISVEKAWLENAANFPVGLTNKLFAYPGGWYDATVQAYLLAAGYDAARSYSTTVNVDYLISVNRFNTACYDCSKLKFPDATETSIRARIRQLYVNLMTLAGTATILSHHNNAQGLTPTQIGYIVTELQALGITPITYKQYIDTLKTTHTVGDATFTKTYTWAPNYALQSNSPCINAGDPTVNLGTDILGKPIVGVPDIGPYEYQPGGGGMTLGIGSGNQPPPWWLK